MTQATVEAKRQRLIKAIHVGKRELQMPEDTYRQVLRTAGNADSTTAMGLPALIAVLEHMKRCGFKVRAKPGDRRQAPSKEARKARALWLFLHELGAVRDPAEAALVAYVQRIARVDDLAWVRGQAAADLIETLKKWAMRYLPQAVAKLQAEAIEAHRRAPFGQAQQECFRAATTYLQRGDGFDMHWYAWEALREGLGRPFPAEIKPLGEKR